MKPSLPIAVAAMACLAAGLLIAMAARMGDTIADQADTSVGAPLPPIAYRAADGAEKRLAHAHGEAMVVLYRSTCSHCVSELARLERRARDFDDVAVFFLTAEAPGASEDPAALVRLLRRPNVERGFADAGQIRHWFGTLSTPVTFVYRNGRLTARFPGDTRVESMLTALRRGSAGASR